MNLYCITHKKVDYIEKLNLIPSGVGNYNYPDKYENNREIKNLDKMKLNANEFIFHAGTKNIDKRIYSNGGRVLNFVVKSESFKKNRVKAIELINELSWNYGFFRKDIGFKVID